MTIKNSNTRNVFDTCNMTIEFAAGLMLEMGAEPDLIVDRFLSYGAATAANRHGSARAAAAFRRMADDIENGVLDSITGENGGKPRRAN